MKTLSASQFKAQCLAVLDEVARTGESVTVLKRGRPVARVVPAIAAALEDSPQRRIIGSVEVLGDLIAPILPADAWEAEQSARR